MSRAKQPPILITILLIMLAILLSACTGITIDTSSPLTTTGPTVTPIPIIIPPADAKIAGPARQEGYVVTINAFETSDKDAAGLAANQGFVFVEIYLTIGSEKAKGVNVEMNLISLKDANGFSYPMTIYQRQPKLNFQPDVPVGSSLQGWVEFEVHANAPGISLIYNENNTNRPLLQLDLPNNLNLAAYSSNPVAAGSNLHFSDFAAPEAKFNVLLPGKPETSNQSFTISGKNVTNYSFKTSLPEQKVTYSITYFDYGSSLPTEAEAQHDLLKDSFTLSSKEITSGEMKGQEIEYTYQNYQIGRDKTQYYGKGRYLITGNRLYILTALYPRNKQVEAEIQTFLDSFKIL